MKPKHAWLVVLAACTWCMASSAYATNTNGQGGTGTHDSSQSTRSNASGHLFGDNTDTGPSATNLPPTSHHSGSRSASSSCDTGSSSAGMSPHVSGCSAHGGGSDGNSGGDNGSGSNLSWQSLLPGSIQ
jgi:hypothetical protein